jgi:hypothetical protein
VSPRMHRVIASVPSIGPRSAPSSRCVSSDASCHRQRAVHRASLVLRCVGGVALSDVSYSSEALCRSLHLVDAAGSRVSLAASSRPSTVVTCTSSCASTPATLPRRLAQNHHVLMPAPTLHLGVWRHTSPGGTIYCVTAVFNGSRPTETVSYDRWRSRLVG